MEFLVTNQYLDEFKEKVSMLEFVKWLLENTDRFCKAKIEHPNKRELREWISWFLDYTEYTENKED
jgi:hypothetical protein